MFLKPTIKHKLDRDNFLEQFGLIIKGLLQIIKAFASEKEKEIENFNYFHLKHNKERLIIYILEILRNLSEKPPYYLFKASS